MTRRGGLLVLALVILGLWVWRSQLFVVSRPGEAPQSLELRPDTQRVMTDLDVVLPSVPVGMSHLRRGEGVLLIHYWAPWESHGARQAALLDSLSHLPEYQRLRVALVTFDPFPSVARYVARRRLRLNVLLDTEQQMRRMLPCPSLPYTYVLDSKGRVAVSQPGEVDWFSTGTRSTLSRLVDEAMTLPASARLERAS